jgi:hypothetical protein
MVFFSKFYILAYYVWCELLSFFKLLNKGKKIISFNAVPTRHHKHMGLAH